MTPEQQAAYVIAQAACALAEIAGMHARNAAFRDTPSMHHSGKDFEDVIDKYGISHNAVLGLFQGR